MLLATAGIYKQVIKEIKMSLEPKAFEETIDVDSSTDTLTNSSENVNSEETKVTLGLLVHSRFINKPAKESAGHKLTEWNVTSSHVKSIARQLKQGKAIIPAYVDGESFGILKRDYQKDEDGKDWTVGNDQIVGSDLIAIDYDHVAIDALPDKRFCDWSFYAYATPSAVQTDQGWDRHRWLIKLPEVMDLNRLRGFRLAFLERYASESDQSVASPHQMIYGCNDSTKFIKEDFSCVLPWDIFAECLEASADFDTESERNTKTGRIRKREKDSPLTKCDHHLLEKLGSLSAILEKLFPDVNFKRKRSRDVHEQYDCVSFLNDEATNPTGFTVFHSALDDEGIYANHRQWGYSISLYELWTRYKIKRETNVDSVDPSDLDVSFEISGSRFTEMFKDISTACEVEEFTFEKSKTKTSKVTLDGENYDLSKFMRFHRQKGGMCCYYWDFDVKIWNFTQTASDAIAGCVVRWLELTHQDIKTVTKKTEETDPNDKRKKLTETTEHRLSRPEITEKARIIFSSASVDPNHSTHEEILEDTNIIGFADCNFNLETKERFEPCPDHFVFERKPWKFDDYDCEGVIEEYRSYFRNWSKSEGYAEMLEIFLFGQMLKLGVQMPGILFLTGKKRTGKGTYCEALKAFSNHLTIPFDRLQKESGFVFEQVTVQTTTIFFDELASMRSQFFSATFKNLTGGSQDKITIDKKGEKKYDINRNFMFLASYETLPAMPTRTGDGLGDRIMFMNIDVDKQEFDRDFKAIAIKLFGRKRGQTGIDNLRRLFKWCVLYSDVATLIQRYEELNASELFTQNRNEAVMDENVVCEFIETMFVHPDNSDNPNKPIDNFTSHDFFYQEWQSFMRARGEKYHLDKALGEAKKVVREMLSQRYPHLSKPLEEAHKLKVSKDGKPLPKKEHGKAKKGIWGMQLRRIEDVAKDENEF
ncbi:DUF5906 domain-containing protein [Chroococcidiopsis sp.]|uniref:DUF5906 domain-containing protein n=1 Tax=Chroococcidiopsis sp. TaxID=3088168 RepID=UPI003F37747A